MPVGTITICANGNTDDCCPSGLYLKSCTCMYCKHPVYYNYMLCTCPPADGSTWCYGNLLYNWQWEQGYECFETDITNNQGTLTCGVTPAAISWPQTNCNPPTTCSLITGPGAVTPQTHKQQAEKTVK